MVSAVKYFVAIAFGNKAFEHFFTFPAHSIEVCKFRLEGETFCP
ncbi:MAG: hypothetical protein BWX50_00279 [Euryarchaeota archaeon ADurb.Bin009]|nr:MAG: hypothetical protein BWX50_00279 [Euryarchaeota archaeon ADurb.Bin009]